MKNVKEQIVLELKKAVKELTGLEVVPSLEHPKDEEHGDYSTNVAMALFQKFEYQNLKSETNSKSKISKYQTPLELAQKISQTLNSQLSTLNFLEKVEAVAPGFINFYLSKDYLITNLEKILGGNKYGSKLQNPNKKIVVEYSSPNIAKPFTVGHLRSTIIGDAVANLLEANGWKVYRDNHIGDWGTQFGKQIAALKYIDGETGEIDVSGSGKFLVKNIKRIEESKNPVKILFDLYVKFHEAAEERYSDIGERTPRGKALEHIARAEFAELEDENPNYEGNPESRRVLWKKCVEWSLKEFQKIYDQLGIRFTENNGIGYGESFFEDKMQGIIKELENKGILKESEGAKLVFFPKDPSTGSGQDKSFGSAQDKYPPLMIVKNDGATLYATRDLATDKFRLEKYGKDIVIINEVGIEQSLYFRQLFELEKMLGWIKNDQRIHLKHGHYRFKDEKMSTRKGNVIWLEEVLEEGVRRAYKLSSEEARKTAKDVGIGAIKWNDLKRGSNLDIIFDWDEILNMDGNSGPYLQYTYARTQSVVRKSQISNFKSQINFKFQISNFKLEPEEISLLRTINRFPEIVEEAAENFAPNIVCNYLFDLSQKFNLFYQKHKIIGNVILNTFDKLSVSSVKNPNKKKEILRSAQDDKTEFRLALTAAVGQIIKNGLYLLGIKSPQKM